MEFAHETLPQRIVFATGGSPTAVAAETERAGGSRVMLIASPREAALAESIGAGLAAAGLTVVRRHEEVVMHVPVAVADRAREAAAASGADILVSVGGGSATGLAKAVALTTALPIVAVPTTYAGSEATDVWGLTEPGPDGGRKVTGVDAAVLPVSIVYDAALLVSLPTAMSVASGLNALAHGIDAMWGPRTEPIAQAWAGEGIRGLAGGLPLVTADPTSTAGIEHTLYGAYLAAVGFASAGSGMHHKICHVLGGMFDLPHAQLHAVVLPHVLGFNAPHAPDAERRIAAALGSGSAVDGLADLLSTLAERAPLPRALRDYGMPESGIAAAVEPILAAVPAHNPVAVDPDDLAALLRAAWEGRDIR